MTPRCDNSLGRRGPCNEPLKVHTDGHGAVHYRCVRCEAREQGRCWNCGKPRTNHPTIGVFCDVCSYAAFRMAQRRTESSPERRKKRQQYDRQRWRNDPDYRAKKDAHAKAWKAANPERVREYKRRDHERHQRAKLAWLQQQQEMAS